MTLTRLIAAWHRVTPRGSAVHAIPEGSGPEIAETLWAVTSPEPVKGALARRYRPNVKPSPKTRALDRGFAHHVETIGEQALASSPRRLALEGRDIQALNLP